MKWYSVFAVAGIMAVLAGCATVDAPTPLAASSEEEEEAMSEELAPMPPPIPPEFNMVQYLNKDLDKVLAVQNQTYRRTPTNTFEVICSLKNLSDETLKVKLRTQWFDETRLHEEGPGAWKIVHLPPHAIDTYKTHSYSEDVSYYHIEVDKQ